ncbi:nucleotide exchange factor GrpE [Sporomusa sp. KB1]|jgi:molecular chaperone GrpE (heat shock protein)|uniref:nucleotide exchange factor GrpE n=1 Tax=Sporomusa sp. KB1 TaxID=943346 RepID=UPI0011A650C2|nr:nucleotide exchange factor GrpE [Sporomusa sp. KB1]TWH48770.1 molecular chaperone GrpE (heat shock protein) [Sporomusa sp. KB1]
MNWFFWKSNNYKEMDTRIEQLDESLQQIKNIMLAMSNTVTECWEQQEESRGQLTKLTRLQYKSGQETQSKLEQLAQGLLVVQQLVAGEERAAALKQQHQYALEVLLRQLDDIDSVSAGLIHTEDNAWQPLFKEWAQRIITALAEMGIYEIPVLGKVFDPQMAVGVSSVIRPAELATVTPYEVAEVVKRGFITGEGQLLRKAQVITYQEGKGSNE